MKIALLILSFFLFIQANAQIAKGNQAPVKFTNHKLYLAGVSPYLIAALGAALVAGVVMRRKKFVSFDNEE